MIPGDSGGMLSLCGFSYILICDKTGHLQFLQTIVLCAGGQYFKAIVKGATRWYIQGLVSYGVPKEGSKQCSSSHYTVFTRVGRYADWIVRTLSRENLI